MPYKELTHAFIIRIWIEHQQGHGSPSIWRGVIENVDTEARVYFVNLDQLREHFARYLQEMGINPDGPERGA